MLTIRFGIQNGTRAKAAGSCIQVLKQLGMGQGTEREGRRLVDDSLIISKPFSHLGLCSQIML